MAENHEGFERQGQAGMTEWMRRVEASNEAQVRYAKKQYAMSRISAVCSGGMLLVVIVCALVLTPKMLSTFRQIDTVMGEMESVLTDLESASNALAGADVAGMLEGVNTLVEDSQTGVAEAVEKISALDIETMNEAIADLKAVVEPLARLFGR